MKNISIFKKISLFFTYRKAIKKIEKQLEREFNIRIDGAYRIYTVLNVPSELIEEPYNLRKGDIDTLAQNFNKEYSSQLSKLLDANGLYELYDFYDVEKVDKYSYLLIFGFSVFNSQKVFRSIYLYWIPSIVIISILTWLYFQLF
jgi:hypothetical protein